MKKILCSISILLLLVGCGENKTKSSSSLDEVPEQSSEVILTEAFADEHNAKNSLDYQGVYKGLFPLANGGERNITLEIQDSTYTLTENSPENDGIIRKSGKYTWNEAGTTIIIEDLNSQKHFFVGENALFVLSEDGKRLSDKDGNELQLIKE